MHVTVKRRGAVLSIQASLREDGTALSWHSNQLLTTTTPVINRLREVPGATNAELDATETDTIKVTFSSPNEADSSRNVVHDTVRELLHEK